MSFTHIYFNVDKRGGQALQDAKRVLDEIQSLSNPPLHIPKRGDRFMLQHDFKLKTAREVSQLFGRNFANKLFNVKLNVWEGPIESGYGLHLVLINEKNDSRLLEFSLVRDQVRNDLMYKRRHDINEKVYKGLNDRYDIVIEEMPKQSGIARTTLTDKESS